MNAAKFDCCDSSKHANLVYNSIAQSSLALKIESN